MNFNNRNKPTAGMGLGCVIQIIILLGLTIILNTDKLTNIIVYAIILAIPAVIIRYLLWSNNMLNLAISKILGPCILGVAIVLALVKPLDIESEEITKPTNQKQLNLTPKSAKNNKEASPHWEQEPPEGVSYQAADENATIEEALAELNSLIGLEVVKEEVEKFTKLIQAAQQRKAEGLKVAPISYHMVFTGNPGTGKTTVARIMAKIYKALGVVKNGHLVETDRGGLIAGYVGQTAIKTNKVIDFALDGILFIDEAYALTEGADKGGYGAEAIATLLKRMEDDRDRLIVIVAGYTDEMQEFISANPGLESRFNRYLNFPDYNSEELAGIFKLNVKRSQYQLSPELEKWLVPAMESWTKNKDKNFGNGRFVRNLFEKAIERQSIRITQLNNPSKEELMTLTLDDLGIEIKNNKVVAKNMLTKIERHHWQNPPPAGVRYEPADEKPVSLDEALAELNSLIGLGVIKEEVEKFTTLVKVSQQRKEAGLKVAPISYHMIFTGNPGTGKTTVARIMAKIYRALGVVKNGHLVETDRGGLIAGYVGQTAEKTNKVIDFALDGILFIDEAYALTENDRGGYGSEAVATLLKRMEDDRDRLIVIVAGYTDEMKNFIDTNPGLESRFNRTLHFPDYSAKELGDIFRLNARKSQYVLSADVEKYLNPAIGLWTKDRDKKFGNGRYVRNLFEKTVERQAFRVSKLTNPTAEELKTIILKDVGIKLKDKDASQED